MPEKRIVLQNLPLIKKIFQEKASASSGKAAAPEHGFLISYTYIVKRLRPNGTREAGRGAVFGIHILRFFPYILPITKVKCSGAFGFRRTSVTLKNTEIGDS